MSVEAQEDEGSEKLDQERVGSQPPDLMGELRKAQMRAEAYSHLGDPLGANHEAEEQNRQRAEEIKQQLAQQDQDEQREAA